MQGGLNSVQCMKSYNYTILGICYTQNENISITCVNNHLISVFNEAMTN